jgi:hypothetical protein
VAFASCPNCGHVLWQLRRAPDFGHPAGNCGECGWTTYWTATPLGEAALRRREELREAAGNPRDAFVGHIAFPPRSTKFN